MVFGCLITTAQNQPVDKLLSRYNSGEVSYISVEELKMKRLKDSVFILDAREIEEYEVSHLPEAVYIGYSGFSEERISEKFKDKSVPLVVYCSIGIRSENIAYTLE